ncbi:MAG: hypothetical protein LBP56_06760 [Odoribacteraceae bacterium]|jgi:hypothetical protein|nr:hypothetical protein [Odoribacteraceae bacterium]
MTFHNIFSVSRYEVKLLRRSWLFRIFAVLALVVLTTMHLGTQSNLNNQYQWGMVALSASIPFVNIYIFNIAQSIIAIFLAGDFMKRDKKLDTAEVTYVRPMSNTDYIAGKTWGVVRVFVSLNLVALAIAAFINVFASESAVNPWAYAFYLVTLSIPSLVFVLGVSFLIMNLVKNQAITLILLLGYIMVTLIYLCDQARGAFDFFAVSLPNLFSDVTGHPDLIRYLTQRVSFFLAGTGMLAFTVVLMKRLPQHPRRQAALATVGGVLLGAGILAGAAYVMDYRQTDNARARYTEIYRHHAVRDGATLTDAHVQLQQDAARINVQAHLSLANQGERELPEIVLYLNPSLKVTRLAGTPASDAIPFRRDDQAIIVERTLRPRERVELLVEYNGTVDENICYLDVPDTEFYSTKVGNSVLRYGKHYAFVSDKFTLLTPEALWYPVAAAPVNPVSLYNIQKNFTRFTLAVVAPHPPVVISQGTARHAGDTLFFENDQPLSALSLVMGDYERKSVMLDTVEISLYHFKGHDYFSAEFTHLSDTLPSILRWARDDYEVRKNRDYPFKRLSFVETPISFATYARNWKGASEYVQPELVLLPELGATLPNGSFKQSKRRVLSWERNGNRNIEELDLEIRVLREFIQNALLAENTFTGEGNLLAPNLLNNSSGWSSKLNKYDISPLFFNHVTFVRSAEFPILDVMLNVMLKQENSTGGGWMRQFSGMNDAQRAAEYLKTKSFEQAIMDVNLLPEVFYEMLKLKATYLKNYILTHHVAQDFTAFMSEFILQRRFSAVNFSDLNDQFAKRFDINLMDLIPEWYTIARTPLFTIRGVNVEETTIDDYTRYMISFHVHNPTPVEGILSVRVEGGRGGGGFGGFGGGGFMMLSMEQETRQFLIPANSYKKIRVLSDNRPNNLSIGTNIAQNLPSEMGVRLPRLRQMSTDTTTGMFSGDSTLFMYDPKEITVDNEDKGFRLIESNQKHTLQSLLNITTEDRYKNMNFWMPPSRWTATVGNNFHGDYIKSGYYKRAGSGQNMAEWQANISLPGFYDIYIYNPMTDPRGRGWGGGNEAETHQYYKILHADGEDEVSVQTNEDRQTWIPVGSFYFAEGDAKITLVDRGFNPRQLIFADAVRWVYKTNQK